MSRGQPGESSGLLHLANRQLLLYEERRKLLDRHGAGKSPGFQFVTISRDVGALGDVIASELSRHLAWKVYDKEIVDYIASASHVRQGLVDQLDERAQNRIHDTISRLLRGGAFGNDEYHVSMVRTLATLAAGSKAILLGRGGAFALQAQPGLHVRVTAAQALRVQRMSKCWNVPVPEARRRVLQVDAERRHFARYHFNVDPDDVRFFHLVFNTDWVTVDQAVGAIVAILQRPASADAEELEAAAGEALRFHSADRDTPLPA
jgi:cytidylate kinase